MSRGLTVTEPEAAWWEQCPYRTPVALRRPDLPGGRSWTYQTDFVCKHELNENPHALDDSGGGGCKQDNCPYKDRDGVPAPSGDAG